MLLQITDILTPSLQEDSIFKSGAPIRDLVPQFKLEGTLAKIEKVGSGGYGDVFQGVWKKSDDEVVLVAIKSIKGSVGAEKSVTEKSGDANEDKNDFLTVWILDCDSKKKTVPALITGLLSILVLENHPRNHHLESRATSQHPVVLRLSDCGGRGYAGFAMVQKWELRLLR